MVYKKFISWFANGAILMIIWYTEALKYRPHAQASTQRAVDLSIKCRYRSLGIHPLEMWIQQNDKTFVALNKWDNHWVGMGGAVNWISDIQNLLFVSNKESCSLPLLTKTQHHIIILSKTIFPSVSDMNMAEYAALLFY